jgi:hypothetical protein
MSSYRYLPPKQVVTNGSMTGTASVSTPAMDMSTMPRIAFQAIWTGTPNGSITIEGSLDYNSVTASGTWTDLGAGIIGPAGVAGNIIFDGQYTAIPWIRLTYTNASSTGTLNVYAAAKS